MNTTSITTQGEVAQIQPSTPKRVRRSTVYRRLRKSKLAMIGGVIIVFYVLVAIFAHWLAPYDPTQINLSAELQSPSWAHLMGTDDKGRDILSRLIYGSQLSLMTGFLSVFIGAVIGVPLGLFSGYYGKWLDTVLMRLTDVLLAFPGILLALAIVSALGPSLLNVIIAVGIFSVPTFARIVRGSTLASKKLEFIDAIRVLGATDMKIIFAHILPNVMSPVIVQATLRLATAILTASGLSFLGLGAQPPTPEWGAMLSNGRNFLWTSPHIAAFPGLAIASLVLGFNLFGDGLRDALDQRMK